MGDLLFLKKNSGRQGYTKYFALNGIHPFQLSLARPTVSHVRWTLTYSYSFFTKFYLKQKRWIRFFFFFNPSLLLEIVRRGVSS